MVHFIWVDLVLRGGTFVSFLFDRNSALGSLHSSLRLACLLLQLLDGVVDFTQIQNQN